MDGDEWLKEMLIVVKRGAGAGYQIFGPRNMPLDETDPDNTSLRAHWKLDKYEEVDEYEWVTQARRAGRVAMAYATRTKKMSEKNSITLHYTSE